MFDLCVCKKYFISSITYTITFHESRCFLCESSIYSPLSQNLSRTHLAVNDNLIFFFLLLFPDISQSPASDTRKTPHRRHTMYETSPESQVLRRVANLVLDRASLESKNNENAKVIPRKLDYGLYSKFEGEWKLNMIVINSKYIFSIESFFRRTDYSKKKD